VLLLHYVIMSFFQFKQFSIKQSDSAMKVGTDSMILGSLIDSSDKKVGLDIGAGTGVLSLMVIQQNVSIVIDAVEIDDLASTECQFNFNNSPWFNRLSISKLNFSDFTTEKKYDLIFSNPPYYATSNLNKDYREAQAKHENSLPVQVVLQKVNQSLSRDGDFWVIIPFSESEKWVSIAESNGLRIKTKFSIKGKPGKEMNRIILCFNRSAKSSEEKEFVVRNLDNSYSEEYIELTRNYHSVDLRIKNQVIK